MIFDYNENYGYDVKIDNIGVGTFDVIARCNNNNDLYNVGIDLSFITTERYTAKWVGSEVEYTGVADDILADNEEGINFVDVTNGIYTFNNRHGIENGFIIRFKGKLSIGFDINFDSGDVDATYYSEYGVAIDDNGKFLSSELNLVNLVSNGDFSNGTAGWTKSGGASSISVINGELSYQSSETGWAGATTDVDVIENNLYYITAKVRATSPVDYQSTNTIGLYLPAYESIIYGNITTSQTMVSGLLTATSTGTSSVRIRNGESDATIYWDDVICINLTEAFGAGNEPTKEQMDVFINQKGFFQNIALKAQTPKITIPPYESKELRI